jgi:hypothetical protein
MLSLREKAFAILSLHRAGRTFKVPIDNQLERLIGGSPVVFKVSEKGASGRSPLTAAVEVLVLLYELRRTYAIF